MARQAGPARARSRLAHATSALAPARAAAPVSARPQKVLDFGCMDGIFTLRLQQLGGGAVGYDISRAAISQAEKFRGAAPIRPSLPCRRGQASSIWCTATKCWSTSGTTLRSWGSWWSSWLRAGCWWGLRRWEGLLGPRPQAGVRRDQPRARTLALGCRPDPALLPHAASQPAALSTGRRGGVHLRGQAAESSGRTLIA